MATAELELLSAYHQFVQRAVQLGCGLELATPLAFEQYQVEVEKRQSDLLDEDFQRLLQRPSVDDQLAIAQRIMKERESVLRKLAE